MRHACLRFEARQDYLGGILLPIGRMESEKKAKKPLFRVKRLSFRVKSALSGLCVKGSPVLPAKIDTSRMTASKVK
jgi:hypothetical protein